MLVVSFSCGSPYFSLEPETRNSKLETRNLKLDTPHPLPEPVRLPSPVERRAAALAHGSALLMFFFPLGNLAGPLLVYFTAGRRSVFVASHAEQSLLFQAVVSLAAWTLFLLAMLHGWRPHAHFASLLASLPPMLWASLRALQGREFRYPLSP